MSASPLHALGTAGDQIVISREELARLSSLLHQVSNDLTVSFGALALLEEQATQSRLPALALLPDVLERVDRAVVAVGQLQGGLRQLERLASRPTAPSPRAPRGRIRVPSS